MRMTPLSRTPWRILLLLIVLLCLTQNPTPARALDAATLPQGDSVVPGPLFLAGDGQLSWLLRPVRKAGSDKDYSFVVLFHQTNRRTAFQGHSTDLWLPFGDT